MKLMRYIANILDQICKISSFLENNMIILQRNEKKNGNSHEQNISVADERVT